MWPASAITRSFPRKNSINRCRSSFVPNPSPLSSKPRDKRRLARSLSPSPPTFLAASFLLTPSQLIDVRRGEMPVLLLPRQKPLSASACQNKKVLNNPALARSRRNTQYSSLMVVSPTMSNLASSGRLSLLFDERHRSSLSAVKGTQTQPSSDMKESSRLQPRWWYPHTSCHFVEPSSSCFSSLSVVRCWAGYLSQTESEDTEENGVLWGL